MQKQLGDFQTVDKLIIHTALLVCYSRDVTQRGVDFAATALGQLLFGAMGTCVGRTAVEAVPIMHLLTRLILSFPSKGLQAASLFQWS